MTTKTIIAALLAAGTLALGLGAPTARADAPACAPVTEKEVEALFDRWNTSLDTLDPSKVAANDAPDAVLLATVSNVPRTTPAMIEDDFSHFPAKHPHGFVNTHTVHLGCTIATDVGTYTFVVDGKAPGEKQAVPARFGDVYVFRDGRWLIAHHHSSAMPEPVIAVTATALPKDH